MVHVFPHHPGKKEKENQNKRQQEKERESIPSSDSRAVEKWWDERMREVRKTEMAVGLVWKKKIMVLACCSFCLLCVLRRW
jgi:hypothetical protein